jgi:hypothetical protein
MLFARNGIEANQTSDTLDHFTSSTAVEDPDFVGDREERSIWLQHEETPETDKPKDDGDPDKDPDKDFEDEEFDEEFEEDLDDLEEDDDDDFEDEDDDFVEDDDF